MIELTGMSLSGRQKELNARINHAVKSKINFDEIKGQLEKSDVDKLYKIGVASKYKNVDYIIEMLQSGDSLYISKALKCSWLYHDQYAHIINPEYLQQNVFPLMSVKMIKKFLLTISLYIKDTRAIGFYTYCNRVNFKHLAMKFLIFTPTSYKSETLKDESILANLRESNEFLKLFLGNSFDLAKAYFNGVAESEHAKTFYQLRHFYSIAGVKYLALLENVKCSRSVIKRMGLRFSKDIMTKHKSEVLKKPLVYLYLLNKNMLVRYSSTGDAKFYLKKLISHECPEPNTFWNRDFCDKYKYILEIIPISERFEFIKYIFNEQYPHKEFEKSIQFYEAQLYKYMTSEEKEKWAISHVESNLEILGSGRDFLWYRFVTFFRAFSVIKKYIQIAVNVDLRIEIICVLVESAKTDHELATLFDYYYNRHINEQQRYKERFVDAILSEHNVYNFGESCWNAFDKILFSLDVYNILDSVYCKSDYKNVSLIYHIIHGINVPEALTKYIELGIYLYPLKAQTDKISTENAASVYQYLLQMHLQKLHTFDCKIYDTQVQNEVRKYMHFILDLMFQYQKSKEDIPEIVNKYIQLDIKEFRNHLILNNEPEPELTQGRLISYLKKSKDLVESKYSLIKTEINRRLNFKLNTFLKILRIYFSNDLAKIFLEMFKEILVDPNPYSGTVKTAVYGIFELADMDFKIKLMAEYVPREAKIDHIQVDRKILCIQEAICNMACYSRPPVPLSDITNYIKGDYVKFCLPMFNSYLVKLPKTLCLDFVKSLLDRPLSVQKHGLRMAFECFNNEDLRKVILQVWAHTNNISLRSIIYLYVYSKILKADVNDQNELFEDLKLFTRSLSQEDDVEIFELLTSDSLPKRFLGEYIQIAWNVVDSLPKELKMFIERRRNVIDCMNRNIYLIKTEVLESIVNEHVSVILKQKQIKTKYEKVENEYLVKSKWHLLHKYVTYFEDESDFNKKSDLVKVVISESIKMWDDVVDNKYILKQFVFKFLDDLNNSSYDHDFKNYERINIISEEILEELKKTLSSEEMYEMFWSIRIGTITRNVIANVKAKVEGDMMNTCLNTFAKEIASLIINSITNRTCFVSLIEIVIGQISNNLRIMFQYLNYYNENHDLLMNNTFVLICLQMLECETVETFMFAATLLPNDIQCYNKDFLLVIEKLKSCQFAEVKFYTYRKYVATDYTFRDYMLPLRHNTNI